MEFLTGEVCSSEKHHLWLAHELGTDENIQEVVAPRDRLTFVRLVDCSELAAVRLIQSAESDGDRAQLANKAEVRCEVPLKRVPSFPVMVRSLKLRMGIGSVPVPC